MLGAVAPPVFAVAIDVTHSRNNLKRNIFFAWNGRKIETSATRVSSSWRRDIQHNDTRYNVKLPQKSTCQNVNWLSWSFYVQVDFSWLHILVDFMVSHSTGCHFHSFIQGVLKGEVLLYH